MNTSTSLFLHFGIFFTQLRINKCQELNQSCGAGCDRSVWCRELNPGLLSATLFPINMSKRDIIIIQLFLKLTEINKPVYFSVSQNWHYFPCHTSSPPLALYLSTSVTNCCSRLELKLFLSWPKKYPPQSSPATQYIWTSFKIIFV